MKKFISQEVKEFASKPHFDEKVILNKDPSWPKISIVTPSYNQAEFLERTILSVLNQNYPNLEYIIIDGGSTDGSVEIIKKYEKYLTYWVSEKDRGQTEALNKGFARATGDLRAWLNADEEYLPGALRCVAEKYEEANEPLTLIYGDRYVVDVMNPSVSCLQTIPKLNPFHYMLYTGGTLFSDATFWTTKIHETLRCINEEYMRCAMDVEWLLRVVGVARRFVHVGRPLSIFKEHSGRMTHKAIMQGIRLNESIRRQFCKEHGIGVGKLAIGWLWFGLRLRVMKYGWKGLTKPPNWKTMKELFWGYQKQKYKAL